jgi:hypothetical protein
LDVWILFVLILVLHKLLLLLIGMGGLVCFYCHAGTCNCFDQMTSSNGQGGAGRRGDCGFREVNGK